jgi:hypothetical protein
MSRHKTPTFEQLVKRIASSRLFATSRKDLSRIIETALADSRPFCPQPNFSDAVPADDAATGLNRPNGQHFLCGTIW